MTSYNKTRIVIRDDKCFITEADNRRYIITAIPYGDRHIMHIESHKLIQLFGINEEYTISDIEWDSFALDLYDCNVSLTVWGGDTIDWVVNYGELLQFPEEDEDENEY